MKIKNSILLLSLFFLVSQMLGCNSNNISQSNGVAMMHVKIVSLEKCSATDFTISLVNEVAREMGVEITLEHAIVKTSEDAIEHRHIGSPTVQINDLDIEPEARNIQQFGVT